MLGWKPAVRNLEGVTLEHATAAMLRQGFVEYDRGEGYAVLRKGGTQVAAKGERFASEAALAQQGDDVELQLRYDSFVLFDTGDLEAAADRIARVIMQSSVVGRACGRPGGSDRLRPPQTCECLPVQEQRSSGRGIDDRPCAFGRLPEDESLFVRGDPGRPGTILPALDGSGRARCPGWRSGRVQRSWTSDVASLVRSRSQHQADEAQDSSCRRSAS